MRFSCGAPLLLLLCLPTLALATSTISYASGYASSSDRTGANSTLQLVHVVCRHGARSPIDMYPTSPSRDHWPMGLGHLTNEGKRQHLELGRFFRQRYDGFLPEFYHNSYIRVESTDKDRALMSAQANLAGLFPPRGADVWDADLPWQPIPVHTRPIELDLKLRPDKSCSAWKEGWRRLTAGSQMAQVDTDNAGLYAYITQHSGYNVTSMATLRDIFETLEIEEREEKLHVPDWALATPPGYTSPAFPDLMQPLTEQFYDLYGSSSTRLGGGTLLKDMVQNMREKVEDRLEPEGRKMFLYTGHDVNIIFLLTTLKVYDSVLPPVSSCVMVELHSEPDLGHTVQLFYRNSSSVAPYQLQLPGCQLSCPWETFLKLTEDVVPGDLQAECDAKTDIAGGSYGNGGGAA